MSADRTAISAVSHVADLADQDHVGVLTQKGPQPAREGQPDVGVDLSLADRAHVVLHGVFQRDDVPIDAVDLVDAGVEGRRLAAPGRPGHEHDAVGALDHPADHDVVVLRQPQLLQADQSRRAVEESHHDVLAVDRRKGGHADVQLAADRRHAEAAVLGQPALGDVERGHDLHARHDRRVERLGLDRDLPQDTVDAEANPEGGLLRLEVEIGGPVPERLLDDHVHEPDDRSVFFGPRARDLGDGLPEPLFLGELLQPAGHRMVPLDRLADLGLGRDDHVHLEPGALLDLVDRDEVERVGHGHGDRVRDLEERKDVVLAGDALRNELDDLGLERVGRDVHDGNAELILVVVEDRLLRDQLQLQEDVAKSGAGSTLLFQGAREPLGGEVSLLHQALSEWLSAPCRHRSSDPRSSA